MTKTAQLQKINRFAIALAVGAGMAVGAAPFMVWVGSPEAWIFLSLSSWFVAGLTLLFIQRKTYHKPNPGEYLLAAFDATFISAFLGCCALILYAVVYGVVGGVEFVLQLLGEVSWDQARAAYLAMVYAAVPFYWLMSYTYADQIAEDMTPETAGLRSPYYFMLTVDRMFMRTNLYYLLAVAVVMIVALFIWPKGWIPLLGLQVYLFLGMTNFASTVIEDRIKDSSGPKKETEERPAQQSAVINPFFRKRGPETQTRIFIEQVGGLYAALGWDVEVQPRTQNPSYDPLLVDVDLLARRGDHAIVVDVAASVLERPFTDFQRPAAIIQAVWALSEHRSMDPNLMGASLVLINRPADSKIQSICDRLGVTLVQLTHEDLETFQTLDENALEERAELAGRLLQLTDLAMP